MLKLQYAYICAEDANSQKLHHLPVCLGEEMALRVYTWLEWRIYLISHSWIRLIQIFIGGPSKRSPSLCNKWKQPGGMILC